jgi:glycerophosphoryl diester phosphodiesterase
MEKYFDRNEVRIVFCIDDEKNLLTNINIEVKDPDFFPKIGMNEPTLKTEISGWLESMQQMVIGFMMRAPRKIIKTKPDQDHGEDAKFAQSVQHSQNTHIEKIVGKIDNETTPAIAKCLRCGSQVTLIKGCCGAGGKNVYKGVCLQCGKTLNLPSNMVERK